MATPHLPDDLGFDLDQSVILVVGAHPHAELFDRAAAARLQQRLENWQAAHDDMIEPMHVVLCTDLWYLNDADMMGRPTIAVGRPGINAASAYLANRLPASFAVADFVHMHFDPEFVEPSACIWGRHENATVNACDLFADRYLAAFMQSVHLLPATDD